MKQFKAALFDLDGTLTTERSVWEYIHRVLGTWEGHAEKFQSLFLKGLISYEEFCERDARVWRGMRVEEVKSITDSVPYHAGAAGLVAYLREKGLRLAGVSSGLSILAERIKRDLDLDFAVANELVEEKGVLTGEVKIHVAHDGKGVWVRELMRQLGAQGQEIIAIGDSQGDLGMFALCGFCVAFNSSSPELDQAANLVVKTGDLADIIPGLPI
ncbi:MAG: HAD-IB family phosphatase [Proteobacteria bacterium]|nr:HAD-IB family phosphatase [Pseudomonadota bacterium]NIS67973.1 HAD-IB family phosphatase [Pseudomonadota bacterium]